MLWREDKAVEMSVKIPVSVVVVTKNEAGRIARCVSALRFFDDIWVLDSGSADETQAIAHAAGARVHGFKWNGAYPKKRQWALERLELAYDRVFFVDADEIVTPGLVSEIAALDWACAGYFVPGQYVFAGKVLLHGLRNSKLCLFDRTKMAFPVVDDLGLEGMGEIEGHYQPVLKAGCEGLAIGRLGEALIHEACDDMEAWEERHWRYACWEAGMSARNAWPRDPDPAREWMKRWFRASPLRPLIAFLHSYVLKGGFLDGRAGYGFAKTRARYYRMVGYQRDLSRQ
jgi:glycosyltransferase involved in cell wall biosynthesis